jgi:hypothetical protein
MIPGSKRAEILFLYKPEERRVALRLSYVQLEDA